MSARFGVRGRTTDVHSLTLLVPLFFGVHNLEETPRMAAWTRTLPGRSSTRVTTPQFVIAVTILTAVVAAAAFWSFLKPASRIASVVLLELQAAIGVNALVPHLALLLRFRRYNPGLLSAILLNLPFSVLFFRSALQADVVDRNGLIVLLLLAPVVMAGSARLALRVAPRLLSVIRPEV